MSYNSKYFDRKPGSLENAVLEALGGQINEASMDVNLDDDKRLIQNIEKMKVKVKILSRATSGRGRVDVRLTGSKNNINKVVDGNQTSMRTDNDFAFNESTEVVEAKDMDKVNPDAVKKKFKDRKDKDIDNDGDVDSSDEYLHKRRKAVSKAIKSEEVELDESLLPLFFALYGVGAMVVLPGLIVYDMMLRNKGSNLDDKVSKVVGNMVSKFKKDKNYKPTSAEIDAAKKLEKEAKSKEPNIFKKAMEKLKSIKSKSEEVELDEDAKMAKQSDDNLKSMMKKMRDAEKKDPKLPSTQFMIKRIGKEMKKRGLKEMNESKSSSGYDLYHKDFSSAMQHAYGFAKKKYGITIDPKEIDDKVATGPRKPSKGKVNKYRLKGDKGTVQIQVTNLDNKRFELNMYKEEVKMNESLKLDEAVLAGRDYKYDGKGPIKISKKMYAKVSRDSKSMIKGKPYMMALDPKTQATVLAPVKFEELDATVESVVEALSAGDNIREQRRMSPTARAKRDAMRDMDARKKRGDDEVKATDADREKADRNIINKIKKAADVKNEKGSFEIKFDKGPARKVPSRLASLVLQKFNKLKPADKLKFQKQAEKSYSDFLRAVKDMTK